MTTSSRTRTPNPICLLGEHKYCTSKAIHGSGPCECVCHSTVDQSFFGKDPKRMITDLTYALWESRRSGHPVTVTLAITMATEALFQTGHTTEKVRDNTIALGEAMMRTITKEYWSMLETHEEDLVPVLQNMGVSA